MIDPRPLLATPTVADAAFEVLAVGVEVAAGRDALEAVPPHAAMARALSDITAAPARNVVGPLRVMSLLRFGASTVAAVSGYRITQRVVRGLKPRSQGLGQGRGYLRYPGEERVLFELVAGLHSEFAECLAEVVVDRAGADEQTRGDFLVGGTVGGET